MQFHEIRSLYDVYRKHRFDDCAPGMKPLPWYSQPRLPRDTTKLLHNRFLAEADWYRNARPYYSVWPVAAESLAAIRLDRVPVKCLTLPLSTILMRFAVGHERHLGCDSDLPLRSILATSFSGRLVAYCDIGIKSPTQIDWPMALDVHLDLSRDADAEESLSSASAELSAEFGRQYGEASKEIGHVAMRYVVALCLLAGDPDLIEPDVLADDRAEFARTGDQKFVDRAVRRGKRGWVVGARMETAPHYRRGHFALRWTGKGREVPKIVAVKGAIVRRKRMNEVPTGYLGFAQQAPSAQKRIGLHKKPIGRKSHPQFCGEPVPRRCASLDWRIDR